VTIEKLLQCSATELEALTDEELKKHFEPYLKITRPELAEKPIKSNTMKQIGLTQHNNKKDIALNILKQLGVNVKKW
jgi:hypothetical protein